MSYYYLKRAPKTSTSDSSAVQDTVRDMLADIEKNREAAVLRYAKKFGEYNGCVILTADDIACAGEKISSTLKDDIQFAYENIHKFAAAQKNTITDIEIEIRPEFFAGQRSLPVYSAGCYVPGGRYSHVASAMMTVTTAKVAGVKHITACSPPQNKAGINPAVIYAAHLCGAHNILSLGGVQGIAALVLGLFGVPAVDILVGPGNQFVAEAKRQLFGRVGIDMIAGPTDSLILADKSADANIVAVDLVAQAEHGYNSPVWLLTNDRGLADRVMALVPKLIAALPDINRINAAAAWRDYAEVVICADREAMAALADRYAPEHLTVQATDLEWWLGRLQCYGSLFLGEETTVAYGDKASGPNHVLPTAAAARYTGGLSVHKFLKIVTWQKATRQGAKQIAEATARISRLEGMEAHARSAVCRLQKYFPDDNFDLNT